MINIGGGLSEPNFYIEPNNYYQNLNDSHPNSNTKGKKAST